jgi:DnaK suppressor protein
MLDRVKEIPVTALFEFPSLTPCTTSPLSTQQIGMLHALLLAGLEAQRAQSLRVAVEDTEAALGRMADGRYGTCQWCDRPIAFDRLKVIPHARVCRECSFTNGH